MQIKIIEGHIYLIPNIFLTFNNMNDVIVVIIISNLWTQNNHKYLKLFISYGVFDCSHFSSIIYRLNWALSVGRSFAVSGVRLVSNRQPDAVSPTLPSSEWLIARSIPRNESPGVFSSTTLYVVRIPSTRCNT